MLKSAVFLESRQCKGNNDIAHLNRTQGTFLLFDTNIPVPVVMGQPYKLSVLNASLVNGDCSIALPHEHWKRELLIFLSTLL